MEPAPRHDSLSRHAAAFLRMNAMRKPPAAEHGQLPMGAAAQDDSATPTAWCAAGSPASSHGKAASWASHGVHPLNFPATSGPFAAPDRPEPRVNRA